MSRASTADANADVAGFEDLLGKLTHALVEGGGEQQEVVLSIVVGV
jgi:hypothetical protein